MLIIKATQLGMCFGVKDAIEAAQAHPRPESVTIYGELVHNRTVARHLDSLGYRATSETARSALPETPEVMITAHGVSDRERRRLEQAGKRLVDTTCPLVRRVHKAVLRLKRLGYFVVVVGRHGHVEVEGLTGDLEHFTVVSSPDEVRRWPYPRLAVVAQTTTPPQLFEKVVARIRMHNGDGVEVVSTICRPTRDRQRAVEELVSRVEALVVVGGRNSNNTRQLARIAEERGIPWLHVEAAQELEPGWFSGLRLVGLTAGTSTPDETIEQVHAALLRIARDATPVSA